MPPFTMTMTNIEEYDAFFRSIVEDETRAGWRLVQIIQRPTEIHGNSSFTTSVSDHIWFVVWEREVPEQTKV